MADAKSCMIVYLCHDTHFLKIFLLSSFYDNASMFIDIGIFFYVRHNIVHSFGLNLHFPLKLISNHH